MTDNEYQGAAIELPIDVAMIQQMIPHRYPFLLVDRVIDLQLEPQRSIRAIKNVTINEPFFQGHFPGHPVMPGVLVIEALAQAAGVLTAMASNPGEQANLYYLAKIDNARFSKIVGPGDQLVLEVTEKRRMRGMGLFEGVASVDGKKVASADLLCAGRS
jgi:3-hydroxyacyl-[acyl-carrier-protein] dehydratase